jgi:hypothetical protein
MIAKESSNDPMGPHRLRRTGPTPAIQDGAGEADGKKLPTDAWKLAGNRFVLITFTEGLGPILPN